MRKFCTRCFSLAMLCLAGLTGSGCSYLFVKGPGDGARPYERAECTTSNGWPVFDVVYGTLNTAANIAMTSKGGPQQGTFVAGAFGSAVLWGSSAIYGFIQTARCREATDPSDPENQLVLLIPRQPQPLGFEPRAEPKLPPRWQLRQPMQY